MSNYKITPKMDDYFYMQQAIEQAKKALTIEEVPIGCVIVHEGEIIAVGYNRRNTDKNVLAHAEIEAINQACNRLGDWRLEGCTLYVTLEPCAMCAGAILQARMDKLVYGASNPKGGSISSVTAVLANPHYNHVVEIVSGVLEDPCAQLMSGFFTHLRQKKKENPLK